METTDPKKYAELRKKVEFQVACEEKAFRIVERLIDNPVQQDFFQDSLHYITPSHYNDIVEERAVSKLCGYPLCHKPLEKVLKQKYMISTKTNKVYDIEGRKNFCSGKCYKASIHVEKQISTAPVWTRQNLPPSTFTFLSLDMDKGKVGEEIFLTMAEDLKDEIRSIEKMDKYHEQLTERKARLAGTHASDSRPDMVETDRNSCDIGSEDRTKHKAERRPQNELNRKSGCETGNNDDRCTYSLERALGEIGGAGTDVMETGVIEGNGSVEAISDNVDSVSGTTDRNNGHVGMDGNVNRDSLQLLNKTTVSAENGKSAKPTKVVKRKPKGSNSQTEYLMKLLDKRKALLSKMADIKPSSVTPPVPPVISSGVTSPDQYRPDKVLDNSKENSDTDSLMSYNSQLPKDNVDIQDKASSSENLNIIDKSKQETAILNKAKVTNPNQGPVTENIVCMYKEGLSNTDDSLNVAGRNTDTNITTEKSPVELIADMLKSWITKESVEYLNIEKDEKINMADKNEFEKQYQVLVSKVDAQEKDFDNLLGEEEMDKDEMAKAPVPDYSELRKETEENYQRVNHFLKGTFTYRVKEKNTDVGETWAQVVLPTVDRYNRMVIRQRIVLDRINKVLPDMLSPLHLHIQEVCTEIKELVATFNLTSENILFKPSEWMLITLIVLKMLSVKVGALQTSFKSSGSQAYLGVVLEAVHSDLNRLECSVNSLLHV